MRGFELPLSFNALKKPTNQAKMVLRPTAFSTTTGATASVSGNLSSISTGTATLMHNGAEFNLAGNKLVLKRGEVLVNAVKTTLLNVSGSTVIIEAGAMALISRDNLLTKVRNVWESRAGSVRHIVGTQKIEVCAGQESVVSRDQAALNAVFKHDSVGRRRVRILDSEGNKISTAEISIISLMTSSPVLSKIALTKDDQNLALTRKMLKMAACIQLVTASHGTYAGAFAAPNK
jgi:hypothetical protein